MIFRYAFQPNAIIGGSLGFALKTAISQGVKRGLFSNEAGMGSTPHAHALWPTWKSRTIRVSSRWSVLFVDTFVVLTMTALVVISCLYAGDGVLASGSGGRRDEGEHGADGLLDDRGGRRRRFDLRRGLPVLLRVLDGPRMELSSARSTWNTSSAKRPSRSIRCIALIFIFLGACLSNDLVWELADMFNQLMVIPNVIALIALAPLVVRAAKKTK